MPKEAEPPRRDGASGHPTPLHWPAPDARLRLLIESATDYAIFSTDPERRVNYWNFGAERVFGFKETEILGQSADVVFTPEDRARGAPVQEAVTAANHGRAEDERWHQRKDGSRFYASGVMAPLRRDDGSIAGFVKIARDLTQRKLWEDRRRSAHEELEKRVNERTAELHAANEALRAEIAQREAAERARQDVVRRLATAQEQERMRLSRELHDEIGQHLAALMLGLTSLEPTLRPTPVAHVLTDLQSLTESIGREVHALAVQLRPTALDDLGLLRALTTYLENWSERANIRAELHSSGLDARLPPDVEIAVYRVVQEALTNVLKHAAARRVSVILNRQPHELVMVIEDDGRGFEVDTQERNRGAQLGLVGMRERVGLLGGRLTVESTPGQGTSLFVRIPLA